MGTVSFFFFETDTTEATVGSSKNGGERCPTVGGLTDAGCCGGDCSDCEAVGVAPLPVARTVERASFRLSDPLNRVVPVAFFVFGSPSWSRHRGFLEVFEQRFLPLEGGVVLINLPLFGLTEHGHIFFGEDVASVYQLDVVLPPFFKQCLVVVGPPLRNSEGGRGHWDFILAAEGGACGCRPSTFRCTDCFPFGLVYFAVGCGYFALLCFGPCTLIGIGRRTTNACIRAMGGRLPRASFFEFLCLVVVG